MVTLSSTGKRVAGIYGATFFALGISLPFYPLLLANRGMSDTQIAIIIAAPMIARALISSALGMFADWIGDRRLVLVLYSLLAAVFFSLLYLGSGFVALLVITVATSIFANASTPVTDAIATTIVRAGGGDYGRMRMWGSISFVVANLVGGFVIGQQSASAIFWMLAVSYWLAALLLLVLPPKLTGGHEAPPRPSEVAYRGRLPRYMHDGVLMAALASAAIMQSSHAMAYSFSSLYWQAKGFSGGEVGVFWAIGVVAEILMFFVSGRLFGGWTAGQMMLLSATAAVTRWMLFPLVSSFSGYMALQCLHALTFACCHLAVMRVILARAADRQAASVQGLYTSASSLMLAAATLASGPLYRAFGGTGFQLMSIVVVVGLLPALIWVGLRRRTDPDVR